MRKLVLAATAAAAVIAAGSWTNRADAMPIRSPAGPRHAIEDADLTVKVHCRWGWPHHLRRWGWWDGCYRGLRRGYVVAPLAIFPGPRRHWRRRSW
jgi:hypothetical protein